jgi:hypothetical protein
LEKLATYLVKQRDFIIVLSGNLTHFCFDLHVKFLDFFDDPSVLLFVGYLKILLLLEFFLGGFLWVKDLSRVDVRRIQSLP